MTKMGQSIVIHTDGASRGNPGPASIAFVIKINDELPFEFCRRIGSTTNNQAEYQAMVAALARLVELKPKNAVINVYADSELMIKQIRGEYRVKDGNLRPLFIKVNDFIHELELSGNALGWHAVFREQNKRADELANQALDALS